MGGSLDPLVTPQCECLAPIYNNVGTACRSIVGEMHRRASRFARLRSHLVAH